MRIDVSGHQFVFPNICSCCPSKADTELTVSARKSTGKRVVHTQTNAWDFPYCEHCVQHVRAAEAASAALWSLVALSVVAGGTIGYFLTPFVGVPIGLLGVIGAVLVYRKLRARALSLCGPACVCVGRAVAYLGWHGSLHKFEIVSLEYAVAFMTANKQKLVNLSPQAIQLLASSGQLPSPHAPRSPRRYRT